MMRRITRPGSGALALVALAWLLLAAALLLVACGGGTERRRVLLIGIDGATLRVIRPLMKQGKLPNLTSIARDGVSGRLRSTQPLFSPRIWNTIATGKVPNKHGIFSFAHDGENGVRHLYLSTDRKVHALWNIVSDSGRTVSVINWWNTYPPEKISGVMVSDHLLAKEIEGRKVLGRATDVPGGPVVFPEQWYERLSSLVAEQRSITSIDDPFSENHDLPKWAHASRDGLSRRFAEDTALVRIALAIEAALHPDLQMVLLPGIDRTSHVLWGTLEPESSYPERLHMTPAERRAGSKALFKYYAYTDELIGKLVENYGPEDLILVVSDHGFEAGVEWKAITGVHESKKAIHGVIFARGPGIPAGGRAEKVSVKDVTPTILSWLGLAIAEDMDGHQASFLEVPPRDRIATYDTAPVERLTLTPSGVEEAIIEQLRELGYFE